MDIHTLNRFREMLAADNENSTSRKDFSENYGLFEGFLSSYGKNEFYKFCSQFGDYYWRLDGFKELAKILAFFPPVGNSSRRFIPTPTIEKATYFLRTKLDLPLEDKDLELANQWKETPLGAILVIIQQIRHNLFHGMKMQTSPLEYERNKQLVALANDIARLILDKLADAHNSR